MMNGECGNVCSAGALIVMVVDVCVSCVIRCGCNGGSKLRWWRQYE